MVSTSQDFWYGSDKIATCVYFHPCLAPIYMVQTWLKVDTGANVIRAEPKIQCNVNGPSFAMEYSSCHQLIVSQNVSLVLISFCKTFLRPSFVDRRSRKAHPKAARLGGSKRVKGLKSNLKDRVEKRETEVVQQVSSEELSLFARLDELEEKEAENAELDQLWQDEFDSKESKTETGYVQKEDDKRSVLTQSENTNQAKKKVTWETLDNKNDTIVNSSDSLESDNDNGDEDIQRTISVRFSSSSTLLKGQVNNGLLY